MIFTSISEQKSHGNLILSSEYIWCVFHFSYSSTFTTRARELPSKTCLVTSTKSPTFIVLPLVDEHSRLGLPQPGQLQQRTVAVGLHHSLESLILVGMDLRLPTASGRKRTDSASGTISVNPAVHGGGANLE